MTLFTNIHVALLLLYIYVDKLQATLVLIVTFLIRNEKISVQFREVAPVQFPPLAPVFKGNDGG